MHNQQSSALEDRDFRKSLVDLSLPTFFLSFCSIPPLLIRNPVGLLLLCTVLSLVSIQLSQSFRRPCWIKVPQSEQRRPKWRKGPGPVRGSPRAVGPSRAGRAALRDAIFGECCVCVYDRAAIFQTRGFHRPVPFARAYLLLRRPGNPADVYALRRRHGNRNI